MSLAIIAVVCGLILLVWSADRFVTGAACMAEHLGMPPLLIGMVVVGFGTSAPEMVVSVLASVQGNPGIALGNAYGSNITNIALILGLTALISPIAVRSQVLRKELPLLVLVTGLAGWQLYDGELSRMDAVVLLLVFAALMAWIIQHGLRRKRDHLGDEVTSAMSDQAMSLQQASFTLVLGLVLLIVSSRVLVWGAVEIAHTLGISDLIIGLTIIAIGTSLPELASSVIAARRGKHDIALGNILGSNIFNTLAVVGIAGSIHPLTVAAEVFSRDLLVMAALTVSLFVIGYGFRGPGTGRINRIEAALLLLAYLLYLVYLFFSIT